MTPLALLCVALSSASLAVAVIAYREAKDLRKRERTTIELMVGQDHQIRTLYNLYQILNSTIQKKLDASQVDRKLLEVLNAKLN